MVVSCRNINKQTKAKFERQPEGCYVTCPIIDGETKAQFFHLLYTGRTMVSAKMADELTLWS
jgi:hypothetical protein